MTRAIPLDAEQRVHDYKELIRRWRRVARDAGLRLREFARADGYPIFYLATRGSLDGGLYISAGIHGDEPAAPAGLLHWAEADLARLAKGGKAPPLFIAPCLNPWGIVNNQRTSARGHDLNRLFDKRITPIPQLKRLIKGVRFAFTLNLHEDYDGRGIYLYELAHEPPNCGGSLLAACTSKQMPRENRRRIEGWRFADGLMAEKVDLKKVPLRPEAIYLYEEHTPRGMTFETPSEFALAHRIRAHADAVKWSVEFVRSDACA